MNGDKILIHFRTTTPLKIERLKTPENYIVEGEIFLLKKGSIVLKDEGKISVLGILQSKKQRSNTIRRFL